MYDPESSLSSCSSFDASDNEGTYPSTPVPFPLSSPAPIDSLPRLSQAFSENIPSAFELSPIMEDPSVFEDMDDILACYSDSPTLGRINESHTHFEFAFDDADWEAEAIESELKSDASDTDSPNNEPKRTRRMSFALRTTERGHDPLLAGANTENNAYKDLLSPPSLTLTFPTPEMQDTSRLPEPVPLVAEPDHLLPFSMPQTPPASTRRSLDRNRDHLVPPTPMPSLPRCVSCGFGFSFDITGSTDMVHTRVDPCGKCQAQWERCQKWYGKRGWGVEENVEEATFQAADPKTEKVLKRASRRLSQIVESVFMSDRKSQRLSAQVSSKRTSKLISFMDRVHPKENTRNPSKDEFASAGNLADPAFLEEFGTRVRDYGDTSRSRIHDFQSPSPDVIQKKKMFKLFRSFSQSTTAFNLKKKNGLRSERRRSFLDLGTSGLKHRRASYRRSYSGRPSQRL
ncbi:hypothetical protein J3R30DRAFT_947007 [Lentinula aciculospora]|uniref:Uncharacterized protein n=1 Tax=Lentinula aciculospora TaxID=153920 RepID=A0A9W9ARV0_9AGAR|nr:hypothetical protein J3R30DRAFT_813124 [Lentinula aciculospora]KAJ4488504.1 hypothetical protein J3R30DRAFT_947007 [Lentinula aciculospora]